MKNSYDSILERFVAFSKCTDDIRFAMVIGSRARKDNPADEWSDLDIVFVTHEPERYIASCDWLSELGKSIVTFTEQTLGGLIERRVLFEGGLDVDLIPIPTDRLQQDMLPESFGILKRGYDIVLDKDNFESLITNVDGPPQPTLPPNQSDFNQFVNDFLFHSVWVAKKLCRGELWIAKQCCDGHLKWLLLKMIEWHASWVLSDHGAIDVWHHGRFLDSWADSRVLDGLVSSFAHYDIDEVWKALDHTKNLFITLSKEVAAAIGANYPDKSMKDIDLLLENYRRSYR